MSKRAIQRRFRASGALAGLAAALFSAAGDARGRADSNGLPRIILDRGAPLSAAELRGRPLLINFWASWCVPCQRELPSLDRLAAKRPDLVIVAVSVDADPRDGARAFAGRYPHLRLGHAAMRAVQAYGALGIPYSVTFDARGREVARVPRALAWDSEAARTYLPGRTGTESVTPEGRAGTQRTKAAPSN